MSSNNKQQQKQQPQSQWVRGQSYQVAAGYFAKFEAENEQASTRVIITFKGVPHPSNPVVTQIKRA